MAEGIEKHIEGDKRLSAHGSIDYAIERLLK